MDKTDIADMRDTLIFGPAYQGGAPLDPLAAVAALPRDAEICGCNGMPAAASVCACTDMTHEDVRRMIKSQKLTSMPAVWQECGWKTSCGCHVCRPALNFYLLADWPLEYQDDPQSRFINERKHANIQKDGTFSVVPRMWGGITTPDELRAIADAADKYMVPTVKVTGGQRIDLLGVKGEDLPAIWSDLNAAGMVSGTCKDIGIICVDSGYQVSIGGAAGMDVRETELLVQVATEDEAMEIIKAVTQLYRENAKYLDRIYKWMGKVGLDWIKERIVDDHDSRTALVARFDLSQSIYRKDPWADHIETQAERYQPVANLTLEAAE